MEYTDIMVTVDNLEAMKDFCGWPVKIGDMIPVNKAIDISSIYEQFDERQ